MTWRLKAIPAFDEFAGAMCRLAGTAGAAAGGFQYAGDGIARAMRAEVRRMREMQLRRRRRS